MRAITCLRYNALTVAKETQARAVRAAAQTLITNEQFIIGMSKL